MKLFNHQLGILAFLSLIFCTQCSSDKVYTTTVTSYASENLDLKAVTDLASKVSSGKELEEKLNDPNTKINNLDLNEDDEIDYIKITEINGEQKGFSLTVEVPGDKGVEEQEIATIQYDFSKGNQSVQTHGNRHIYGPSYYYFYSPGYGHFPMSGYFSRRHQTYRSEYGHKNKPSNFTSSKPIAPKEYAAYNKRRAHTNGYASSMKIKRSSSMKQMKSPNIDKVASRIKAPLKSPSTAQKNYQKSTPSKYTIRVKISSSSRYGSFSSSRSRSSFGGGK